MVLWLMGALYFYVLLVAALNALLMRRPTAGRPGPRFAVLIPARNEAENLERLIPALRAQTLLDPDSGEERALQVIVFDDESDDDTAETAAKHGATVLRAAEPLPAGWVGKNRACHALAQAAAEAVDADWWLFLDADVTPTAEFARGVQSLIAEVGARCPVISGFPKGLPGRGLEPVYLSWVPWSLLGMIPFGLVSKTGKNHVRFTNGQFVLWKASTYVDLWPHERLKDAILEDVRIGRLLASEGVPVEVVRLDRLLAVRMYETFRQALDGMTKNTFEITGSTWGSVGMATLFALLSFGWLAMGQHWGLGLGALLLSKLITDALMRGPLWVWPLAPASSLLAAYTFLRTIVWRRNGTVTWKGRTYS